MMMAGETYSSTALAKLAMAGLVAGALAGCSADSARFASLNSPYPNAQPAPEVTGSLGPSAPTGRVDYAPMDGQQLAAPVSAPPSGPPVAYAPAAESAGQPLYGAPGYAAGAAAPVAPAQPPAEPYQQAAAPRPASGGMHVVVGGETLSSISRSYGVTPTQLAASNNIGIDSTLRIGQTLAVPAGTVARARPAAAPAPTVAARPAPAAPAPVQTAMSVPAAPSAPAPAPAVAAAPVNPPAAPARPAPSIAGAALTPLPASVAAVAPELAAPAGNQAVKPTPAVASAQAPKAEPAKATAVDDADDSMRAPGSGPQFRAPVRGRVISGFGPKPGGARNDGVNFAVPEGTAVRAAEDGTVAYAGSELKGYGNLVLIKHADGYVTAYAHNSELSVKRGDTVRRGQIIAKAGQTGGVTSPQLHFEIRKGSQPVDPSQYVAGL